PHQLCDLYLDEILPPAIPFARPGASADEGRRIAEALGRIKDAAETKLKSGRKSSLLGLGFFCMSNVMPADCWKTTAEGVFTSREFLVQHGVATIQFDYCLVSIARPWLHTA